MGGGGATNCSGCQATITLHGREKNLAIERGLKAS
jgi:hypothetical protein